jgi:hypothetical protein
MTKSPWAIVRFQKPPESATVVLMKALGEYIVRRIVEGNRVLFPFRLSDVA